MFWTISPHCPPPKKNTLITTAKIYQYIGEQSQEKMQAKHLNPEIEPTFPSEPTSEQG